jgi:hypothetical protein
MSLLRLSFQLIALTLTVWLGPAWAAPLRVIVHFQGQAGPQRPLGFWLRPNGMLPIAPPSPDPRREAVLEVLPKQPMKPPPTAGSQPKSQLVRIVGGRLLPRLSLLEPGGELTLKNETDRPATVELLPAQAGRTSLLVPPSSQTKLSLSGDALTLLIAGPPKAQATVIVPSFIATQLSRSESGKVAVATVDVPPGRYSVRLRLPAGASWQEEVVVGSDGTELPLHVQLGEDR